MSDIPLANLRRTEREPATLPISLVLREGRQAKYEATTVDLSLGGASVQTSLELVPGEWVGIVPKGEFPFAIPSRVVWVRPKDAAGLFYLAGLQFLDTLPV
jgi:Tfp pilus assembly protein PilZ